LSCATRAVFDTLVTVEVGTEREAILARASEARASTCATGEDTLGISLDETGPGDVHALLEVFFGGRAPLLDAALEAPASPSTLRAKSITCSTPCSTSTTPRRRCCATCAASSPRISP
jgi:hypothetical protein